jgi:hypothetical protein
MAIDVVTEGIRKLLAAALDAENPDAAPASVVLAFSDNGAGEAALVLIPFLVTPSAQQRNTLRVRPFPELSDPPQPLESAVPLDVQYLLTTGSTIAAPASLAALTTGIRALEAASPLTVQEVRPQNAQLPAQPDVLQTVWLSLLPMTSDEASRIWGLFPEENARGAVAFLATPVWIDPVDVPFEGKPVVDDEAHAGRPMEPA